MGIGVLSSGLSVGVGVRIGVEVGMELRVRLSALDLSRSQVGIILFAYPTALKSKVYCPAPGI